MPVLPAIFSRTLASTTQATHSLHSRTSSSSLAHTFSNAASSLLHHHASPLSRRQEGAIIFIPIQYQGLRTDRSPGAVVGIVLGSVAAFLLLIWLLWIASNGSGFIRTTALVEEDVVVRSERSRTATRSHRSSRRRNPEMVTKTKTAAPRPQRERVIRTERIVRERESVPPPRERSRMREVIVEEEDDDDGMPPPLSPERRVPGDDVIEVEEEHDSLDVPNPRRKSRRGSYRS